MARIIINADDFGLTDGVCTGIVQAIQSGCLTATSAMVCVPGAPERIVRWSDMIPGCIGAHLQLTGGRPILPASRIPSLVTADGLFPASRKEVREPRRDEIVAEWEAQIETLCGLGVSPNHIDSHHHIHKLPAVQDAYCEIARRVGAPARSLSLEMTERLRGMGAPCADKSLIGWYGEGLSVSGLLAVIRRGVKGGPDDCLLEVMAHPGFVDDELRQASKYVEPRETELAVLCDPGLRKSLQAERLALYGFDVFSRNSIPGQAAI